MAVGNPSFRVSNASRLRPGRCARRLLAFAVAGMVVVGLFAQPGSAVERLLTERMGFSAGDMRELARGSAVVRSLRTRVRQEVAHVAAVYLDASPDEFVARFRDIEEFERGPGIPQIGRFGIPPRIEDLEALTLGPEDVAELPRCRPGDCEIKLSVDAMARFRNEVDWAAEDAAGQADAVARTMILDLLRAYRAQGNAALGSYVDGKRPLAVAEHFRSLLASRDPLPVSVPALLAYLDGYPQGLPDGADEFFYWTVVDFGMKPTIRVNHVTILPLADRSSTGVAYAIATKQLYASHYFHTTLELRFLLDRTDDEGRQGSALVSITRSRNDGMTGFRGLFLRPIIRRRSRDAVRGYLEHVKRQVERPDAGESSSAPLPPSAVALKKQASIRSSDRPSAEYQRRIRRIRVIEPRPSGRPTGSRPAPERFSWRVPAGPSGSRACGECA